MRNFLNILKYRLQELMQGRYGFDDLSKKLSLTSLVLFLFSLVTRIHLFYLLAIFLLLWSYFRCFSRNFSARQKELSAYYILNGKLQKKIKLYKNMWKERKTYRYFKCPNCKTMLKVPKGKGKIQITCRTCQTKLIKKT